MDTSLVFSGGSTKVPLHIGAIKAIEEKGIKATSYWGTSVGGIIAACLSYGYSYMDLYKLAIKLDFVSLLKGTFSEILCNLFNNASLIKGDKFNELYDELFGDTTFKQLPYPCHIIGHCLDTCTYEVLDYPNMKIKDALRISTSIPMLLEPVKYNGKYYVDGGVSHNFPIDLVQGKFIGHLIQSPKENYIEGKNIISFGLSIIDQLIESNSATSIKNANKKGIIVISEYPLSTTQFSVPLEDKLRMIDIGYNNMKEKLKDI